MKAQDLIRMAAGLSVLTLLIVVMISGGCGSEKSAGPDVTGPDVYIESVTAPSDTVPAGDTTQICARVVEGEATPVAVAGVTVTFGIAGNLSKGEFTATSATTGEDGRACVGFIPSTEELGLTDIKASISGAPIKYLPLFVEEGSGLSDAPLQLAITMAESSLPADGESQSNVAVTVWRLGLLSPGDSVRLVAGERFEDRDHDGVFSDGDLLLQDNDNDGLWDAMGSVSEWVVTGGSGVGTGVYTAGTVEGDYYVKATVDSVSADGLITLVEAETNLSIEASALELLADGYSVTHVTATVLDEAGDALAGKIVRFTAGEPFEDVDGDGFFTPGTDTYTDKNGNESWDAMGLVSPTAAQTDELGKAYTTYTAGTDPGEVTLFAATMEGDVTTTLQLLQLPPVASVTWSWDPETIYAGGTEEATLTVTPYDINGARIPGKEIGFSVDAGAIEAVGNADIAGEIKVTFEVPSEAGTVTVTMTSDGWTDQFPVEVHSYDTQAGTVRMIALEAQPSELWVKGVGKTDHAAIRATCYLNGGVSAPAGIPVTFTLDSNLGGGETLVDSVAGGQILTMEVLTDEDGVALALLRSGTISGPLEVTAAAGDLSETIHLGISSGPPEGIYCVLTQEGSGVDGWFIQSRVYDAYHNPVPDGTVVVFTADAGLVYTDNATGTIGTEAGLAEATYLAPQELHGTATITCRTDGEVSCELTVDLGTHGGEPGPIARIELDLSLAEIAVDSTGGPSQCQVIATCYDEDNLAVGRGREVTFEIIAGPGGGESLLSAGWGPVTAETNDNSQAIVTISSGTKSGTVRLEARADSAQASQSTLVSIAAGPPHYISVGANPLNIRGWDRVGEPSNVVAYVSDIYNNPVMDGTVVYFTCDEGIMRGDWEFEDILGSSMTDGGVAVGTYFSGLPRDNGRVVITASSSGGEVIGTGGLISSGPPASVTFVSPTPPVLLAADGDSEFEFWVEVLDINDNYVLAGTEIRFRAEFGTVPSSGYTEDGIAGSFAGGDYQSTTLDYDASWTTPDDGIGAVDYVVAGGGLTGGINDALEVRLLTGSAYSKNCDIDIDSSTPRNSAIAFEVVIKDRNGNPLGGHSLSLAASKGLVTDTAITNLWGTASNLTFVAPGDSGDVVITVTDNDPTYGGVTLSEEILVN